MSKRKVDEALRRNKLFYDKTKRKKSLKQRYKRAIEMRKEYAKRLGLDK